MKKKSKNKAIGVRFAALIMMGAAIGLYFMLEKQVPGTQTPTSVADIFGTTGVFLDFEIEDKADFYVTEKGSFFFCTKDGVKFYTASGEKKWDKVFTMINPMIVGEGEMLAVAEPKGRELHVYGPSGLLYSLLFEHPILSFTINRIGYTSVILQKDNDYEINVYNETGGEPLWQWINENYNVFPVYCAVSDDGRIIAFSLFDINEVNPKSLICFAYPSVSSGKASKYSDSIFSSKTKQNQLVGALRFMADGMVISISDEEITGMQIEEGPASTDKVTDKWTITFNNKIDKISFNGDKGFALALGEGLLNKAPEPTGTVMYYNLKGQATGEYMAGDKLSSLWTGSGAMVIGTDGEFAAVDLKGKKLWEHKPGLQIKQMMLLGNTSNVLSVTNTKAELLKRGKS